MPLTCKYSPNSRCRPPSCLPAGFAMFLAIIWLAPAVVLTLEKSEVSAIFAFTTNTTQLNSTQLNSTQLFSVNSALTLRGLHF